MSPIASAVTLPEGLPEGGEGSPNPTPSQQDTSWESGHGIPALQLSPGAPAAPRGRREGAPLAHCADAKVSASPSHNLALGKWVPWHLGAAGASESWEPPQSRDHVQLRGFHRAGVAGTVLPGVEVH